MNTKVDDAVNDILNQFARRDRVLVDRVKELLHGENLEPLVEAAAERLSLPEDARRRARRSVAESAATVPEEEAQLMAETIVRPFLRPVLKIRDNTLVMEFFGADVDVWRDRLGNAKDRLDAVIPAVGRVEVTNHPGYIWVGTAWLIADDVIVTNRHVAREFARRDNHGFVFRTGLDGPMTCKIDFLEEFERTRALEFTVSEVLWIAPSTEADIAFLRAERNSNGTPLPRPVPLSARAPGEDDFIATIGYPARDDEFPDQELARRVFGDVYDKKRLAPGQVLESPADEVLHDCSTLGGNSGSLVVDLNSGEAVALHYAGLFPKANFAVPAAVVKDRLRRALRGEFASVQIGGGTTNKPDEPKEPATQPPQQSETSAATATFVIPLEITIGIGAPSVRVHGATVSVGTGTGQQTTQTQGTAPSTEAALAAARKALAQNADVREVRMGYRFRNNWITDEPVIVVELKAGAARAAVASSVPEQFDGIGVEVRSAPLLEQLRSEGVVIPAIEERVARGNYRRPTHLQLREVKDEPMASIFHVSPDSGFPNLRSFLARTRERITGTMYEFESEHVLKALLDAVRTDNRTLQMVTQKEGTRDAVNELANRLQGRFEHVWASVSSGGTVRLFPRAYHIKVAVRDGEEFWLSSGNFKDSGQPNIDPAGEDQTSWGPLRNNNREWHVIIENNNLARQFEEYIRYDFSEAQRVPVPEAVEIELPDMFVPDIAAFQIQPEAPAQYFDPLILNRPLRIQPLLSPDNYIDQVTALIEEAERSIYVHNQSFNLLEFDSDGGRGNNEQPFYDLLSLLRDRQETHDVKIIFRHAREFGERSWEEQKPLLERLQRFGFDMNENVKLQYGCHTKGVIVDGQRVLLGSHNWTNQGALYNRDASLIVYDAEVARYFQAIFEFDWRNRALRESVEELPAGGRLAGVGEETPAGMRRVSLAEVLYDYLE